MDGNNLPPWEHHFMATGLPRYNYKPNLQSGTSYKGFIITCNLDREKSATKEAMAILSQYLRRQETTITEAIHGYTHENGKGQQEDNKGSVKEHSQENAEDESTLGNRKEETELTERKLTEASKVNERTSLSSDDKITTSSIAEGQEGLKRLSSALNPKNCGEDTSGCGMFLVKMAKKGIVSVFMENGSSDDPVQVLSNVLEDVENGEKDSPKWCQRIIPVQATCLLSKESMRPLVIELVKQHMAESLPTDNQPLKFAIGYNKRGADGQDTELFSRMECIKVVTEAISQAAQHTVVDLRAPQMVVIIEVIPISGIQEIPICGIAVVSGKIVNTKPKLCIKPFPTSKSHPVKKLRR